MTFELTPDDLTGELVLELRTRHKMSRQRFSELAGFQGRSTARLSNIENKNSWKPGDREAVARVLSELVGAQFDPRYHTPPTLPVTTQEVNSAVTVVVIGDDGDEDTDEIVDVVDPVRPIEHVLAEVSDVKPIDRDPIMDDDDTYRVSNGELQSWKRCRRRWWLGWYRGLTLRAEDYTSVRAIGDRVHRALQRWYAPEGQVRVDPRDALERVIVADWTHVSRLAAERQLNEDQFKSLAKQFADATNLERAMVEGYVQWLEETGADAELRVIAPETSLTADLEVDVNGETRPIRAIGLLDVRVHRVTDGRNLFLDHKPHPLSTPILTPTGWVKLGDVRVGDVVSGAHGEPVRVTHVFDRGVDDVYDVTLNDNTVVSATSDHPWMAKDTVYGPWKIVATGDLKTNRHRLMSFSPLTTDADVDLPIEPYLLGAWLANGDRSGREIADGVSTTLAATGLIVNVSAKRPHHTQPLYKITLPTEVRQQLDELNLLMKYSAERFIPHVYLHSASYQQRLALLHGLMDGDGCLTTYSRSSVYVTTSPQLADDVAALVRSLGGWAKRWTAKKPNHVGTVTSGYDTGLIAHSVSIRSEFIPFRHVHHAGDWVTHKAAVRGRRGTTSIDRIVKSVDLSGREPVRCLELDSIDKLYVTTDYVVSHNTVGDLSSPTVTLPLNEQMLHYDLLEFLNTPQGEKRCDGALYNMMRRVGRSKQAKPPFYSRVEVHHNIIELESYKRRMMAASRDILLAIEALERGEDHHSVVYPSPRPQCSWDCDFLPICNLLDDGSAGVNDMINALYREYDPRDRYDQKEGPVE